MIRVIVHEVTPEGHSRAVVVMPAVPRAGEVLVNNYGVEMTVQRVVWSPWAESRGPMVVVEVQA